MFNNQVFTKVPEGSSSKIHADYEANLLFYDRILKQVVFHNYLPQDTEPECKPELDIAEGFIVAVRFPWGAGPQGPKPPEDGRGSSRKGVYIVELMQRHWSFKEELCKALNSLVSKKVISRAAGQFPKQVYKTI